MKKIITIISLFVYFNAKSQPFSISPSNNNSWCPGVSNAVEFTISLPSNISKDSVEAKSPSQLTIISQTASGGSANHYLVRLFFTDQWNAEASFNLQHKRNTNIYNQKISFPYILSTNQLNTKFGTHPIWANVDLCARNVNIIVDPFRYVIGGGNQWSPTSLFGSSISTYQYLLPSGVTPVSGLTAVPGFPNLYNGFTNVTVSTNNFGSAIVKIRPFNSLCPQSLAGSYSDFTIARPIPDLVGPSNTKTITLRCGDVAPITFNVNNVSTGSNCITSYTWKIANKGWKYLGTIATSDVVTSTPTITLEPSNINSNPPKSFSVDIAAGSEIFTSNMTINYLAPFALIPNNVTGFPLDCNEKILTATLGNLPTTPYNLIWTATSPNLINGSSLPQVNVGTTVTLTKTSTTDPAYATLTIAATCGNIENNATGFSGCQDWEDFGTTFFAPPQFCNDEFRASVNPRQFAVKYEWYAYYLGQYHLINETYDPSIQINLNVCADEVTVLVRALVAFDSFTPLMSVGSYTGICCGSYRLANPTSDIKVYPNPSAELVIVDYENQKNKEYTIQITTINGDIKLVKKVNTKNNKIMVNTLKAGKYILTIIDGKKVTSKQIEIKR